ncbi:DUF1572 domain-containing protein [Flavobacteriaceae bacterium F08102]|nr:DUF1572 domain-containing protein [Flavobacteriaceae bacterium F08102]
MESYIESIQKQFTYYKYLGDQTLARFNFDELSWKYNEQSNSMSLLVKHMAGNMLSRWTNFFTEDGEKEWRQRDLEFEDDFPNKEAIIKAWNHGWECLFQVINSLTTDDLDRIIYIRNQGHTVTEAINRQLCHYSYHVGQLVFIGKMIQGADWNSLSIPKNRSSEYNQQKFKKDKDKRHFTDDIL